MECFKIENLNFKYPARTAETLHNINLTIESGEFICVCGRSGCGKTTLLRLLKPSLSPAGERNGNIYFCGKNTNTLSASDDAEKIGFVMQNVEGQLVTDKVWHEIAFGLENLGISTPEIRTRVSEMAEFFGISDWFDKDVCTLSGGEKQIVNLASVMVMRPDILILDEPTSRLDPIAADEFIAMLAKINRDLATTVIISEHRTESVFPVSDRVIVIDDGEIIADSAPQNVGKILADINHPLLCALPAPMRVCAALGCEDIPITVRDGRICLENEIKHRTVTGSVIPSAEDSETDFTSPAAIDIQNIYFRYEMNREDVIKGLSLRIRKGEFHAIIGGNGTGKTTTLSLICGLKKPHRGKIEVNGKCAMLHQNPQVMFTEKTVYDDLRSVSGDERLIDNTVKLCELEHLLKSHPYDLSGGEIQRAALAKILLAQPDILLLDEPTKGLDAYFKIKFASILKTLTLNGITVVTVSHDTDFCAEYADRCSMFFNGTVTATRTSRKMFASNTFYTTSARRMAEKIIPQAITAKDIILALGCTEQIPPKPDMPMIKTDSDNSGENIKIEKVYKQVQKNSVMSLLSVLIAIPLTIFFGIHFLNDRKYYFISLLIIFEILIPFSAAYERKKPKAREIVTISVLCALTVCGRMAFYMIPQVKPAMAIIIISGAALGGEAGFLVGAISAFVSNFFFGQGPWTPWQMFAFGLCGFLAGIMFYGRKPKKIRTAVCIFGFLATIIIYGGVVNLSSVLMMNSVPTLGAVISAYTLGFPFDLIHAVSTVVFLWFLTTPITDRLNRIKTKHGFYT